MGSLNRFDLKRIIREYKTAYLFETGTLWGDGVAYALQSPFKKIISVEVVPEIAVKARQRFTSDEKVAIIENDSISALQEQLPLINENVLFWLDAHFPGADAGLAHYGRSNDESLRLPLIQEIETISKLRQGFQDVLILDDMRIYEDGPYEKGNVPEDALPKGKRDIEFVNKHFERTHVIIRSYLDEGYILLFPKNTYLKKHNNLANLLSKRSVEKDHYLVK